MHAGSDVQQSFVERFTTACRDDARVVAAFLGGSFAAGTADEWSDLDIYLITTDGDYDAFFAERRAFLQRLGRPVFLQEFNGFGFDMILFTYADDVEGELALGRESGFHHIHGGPYQTLVDKKQLLEGAVFPLYAIPPAEQRQTLQRSIDSFWESLSHFIRAVHRRQLWTAYGSLHDMRRACLNLARLKYDFGAEAVGTFKVEQAIPQAELQAFEPTIAPLEPAPMLEAARLLIGLQRQYAPSITAQHGLAYPSDLDRVLSKRFEQLVGSQSSRSGGKHGEPA